MDKLYKYMVVFNLPELNREIMDIIPKHRLIVEKYLHSGVILSYTLSADRHTLWIVFQADTESELFNSIESLPLTVYCEYDYNELMFYDTAKMFPAVSLN